MNNVAGRLEKETQFYENMKEKLNGIHIYVNINKVIALRGMDYVALDIDEAINTKKHLDEDMIRANKILSL